MMCCLSSIALMKKMSASHRLLSLHNDWHSDDSSIEMKYCIDPILGRDVNCSPQQCHLAEYHSVSQHSSKTAAMADDKSNVENVTVGQSAIEKDFSSTSRTKETNTQARDVMDDRLASVDVRNNPWLETSQSLRSCLTHASLQDYDNYLDQLSDDDISYAAYGTSSGHCQCDTTRQCDLTPSPIASSSLFTNLKSRPLDCKDKFHTASVDENPARSFAFNHNLETAENVFNTVDEQISIPPLLADLRQNICCLSMAKCQYHRVSDQQRWRKAEIAKFKLFHTSSSSSSDDEQLSGVHTTACSQCRKTNNSHGVASQRIRKSDSLVTKSWYTDCPVSDLVGTQSSSRYWECTQAGSSYLGNSLMDRGSDSHDDVNMDQLLVDVLSSLDLNSDYEHVKSVTDSLSYLADIESSSWTGTSSGSTNVVDQQTVLPAAAAAVTGGRSWQLMTYDSDAVALTTEQPCLFSNQYHSGFASDCYDEYLCNDADVSDEYCSQMLAGHAVQPELPAAVAIDWRTLCFDQQATAAAAADADSCSSDTSLSSWEGNTELFDSETDDEFECNCSVCLLDRDDLTASWLHTERLLPSLAPDNGHMSPPLSLSLPALNDSLFSFTWSAEPESETVFSNIGILDSLFQDVIVQMLQYYPDIICNQTTPPVTEEEFCHLNSVQIVKSQLSDELSCPICLSPYEDGESAKCLPCQHLFHTMCIQSWLSKAGTCPVCRDTVMKNVGICDYP